MKSAEEQLAGSPYLVPTDSESLARFRAIQHSAIGTQRLAVEADARIKRRARELLRPLEQATRADLVVESNKIEGYVWSSGDVRQAIKDHENLLAGPESALTEIVKADRKLYQVLGLYRAHEIADNWQAADYSPKASHIRELHRLILGESSGSGSYKLYANAIGGREDHKTTDPVDVPRAMSALADWWATSTGDPLLTATVIHAWLAHIHPFSDGNGRLARIIANLELSRHGYAPLIVRSDDDRGQYYDALQESDDGNILPLYELFERVVRRQSKTMALDTYIEDVIADRMLSSEIDRFNIWSTALRTFAAEFSKEARAQGWSFSQEGQLSLQSFALLANEDTDGNGWFATLGPADSKKEWLLWFGFRSHDWRVKDGELSKWPSIFVSRRVHSRASQHPYKWDRFVDPRGYAVPDEVRIIPLREKPVKLRYNTVVEGYAEDLGVQSIMDAIVEYTAVSPRLRS